MLLPVLEVQSEFDSVAELDRIGPADFTPERVLCAGFHPQGTAGMGRVVDGDLRLLGSSRIWVADASVFPESPRVNPQITIMALSLRLADRLAQELQVGRPAATRGSALPGTMDPCIVDPHRQSSASAGSSCIP